MSSSLPAMDLDQALANARQNFEVKRAAAAEAGAEVRRILLAMADTFGAAIPSNTVIKPVALKMDVSKNDAERRSASARKAVATKRANGPIDSTYPLVVEYVCKASEPVTGRAISHTVHAHRRTIRKHLRKAVAAGHLVIVKKVRTGKKGRDTFFYGAGPKKMGAVETPKTQAEAPSTPSRYTRVVTFIREQTAPIDVRGISDSLKIPPGTLGGYMVRAVKAGHLKYEEVLQPSGSKRHLYSKGPNEPVPGAPLPGR